MFTRACKSTTLLIKTKSLVASRSHAFDLRARSGQEVLPFARNARSRRGRVRWYRDRRGHQDVRNSLADLHNPPREPRRIRHTPAISLGIGASLTCVTCIAARSEAARAKQLARTAAINMRYVISRTCSRVRTLRRKKSLSRR